MRIYALVLSTLALILTSCRTPSSARLEEISLFTDRYSGFVTDVELYVHAHDTKTGQYPETLSQLEVLAQSYRNEIETLKNNPLYRSEDGSWVTDPHSMPRLAEAMNSIQVQLSHGLQSLEGQGIYASFPNLKVTDIQVPAQNLEGRPPHTQKQILIRWSGTFPVHVEKQRTIQSQMDVPLPKSIDYFFVQEMISEFKSCLAPRYQSDASPDNFFANFNKSLCDFKTLNQRHQKFQDQLLVVKPVVTKSLRKAPEYCRVWEDGVLRSHVIFSKYEEDSPKDYGYWAYTKFVWLIQNDPNLKVTLRPATSKNSTQFLITDLRTPRQLAGCTVPKRSLELTAAYVADIQDLTDEKLTHSLLGPNISTSDFIMYNGHAGYGAAVDRLEEIFKPASGHYLFLDINGCYTYSYSKTKNPNIDLIVNAKPSYFTDMPQTSFDTWMGFAAGETYEELLKHAPPVNRAIVLGDDVESVPGAQEK